MNWTQLFARAEQLIHEVLAEAWKEQKPLLLQPSTRPGSLLLLAVGFLWPFEVILDEKNLLQDGEAFRLDESQVSPALLPASAVVCGDEGAPSPWSRLEEWQLTLCTSGSTGEPKRIRKSGAGLLAEVRDLASLYKWTTTDAVLSLVSPLHIYGLLHSFLLPWYCRSSVEFVSFQDGPVDPGSLQSQVYSAVIAVPATWSFVKDLLIGKDIHALIMSGAPFGDKRRRELQTIHGRPQKAWEILGSTETGGLGYRSLLQTTDFFTLLRSVRIFEDDGQQWVESPYLQPEKRWPLADRLELKEDATFLHQGRSDRIFKYAGQRYALGEVEKALSQSFQNADSFARFNADESVAQGGWLEAWIESESAPVDALVRQNYRHHTRAPFPHVLHFTPRFPRDTQGKLQILASLQSDMNKSG